MKKLKGNEIINMYLNFFGERGHTIIESASLIPKDDPTVLWINACLLYTSLGEVNVKSNEESKTF